MSLQLIQDEEFQQGIEVKPASLRGADWGWAIKHYGSFPWKVDSINREGLIEVRSDDGKVTCWHRSNLQWSL